MNRPVNFDTLKNDLISLWYFAKSFVRHPLQSVQAEPDWDYQRSAVSLVCASVLSALVAGIFQKSFGHTIVSVVLLPFITLIMAAIVTFVLSYLVRFVHQRQLETEKVFQVVAIAFLPFLFFRIFRTFAPPVTLLGLAATCALLIVGLTDRFLLPRKSVIKIISIFFAVYLVYWGIDLIRHANLRQMASQNISDESLKVLEQEFSNNEE